MRTWGSRVRSQHYTGWIFYIGLGATWDAYPGRKWTGRQIPDVNWAYRGRHGWLCGVIDHDEQHILSTECLGYGLVVIVWVSAFDIVRWVAGLAKKGFLDTYGMDVQFYTSLLVALWGYRPC